MIEHLPIMCVSLSWGCSSGPSQEEEGKEEEIKTTLIIIIRTAHSHSRVCPSLCLLHWCAHSFLKYRDYCKGTRGLLIATLIPGLSPKESWNEGWKWTSESALYSLGSGGQLVYHLWLQRERTRLQEKLDCPLPGTWQRILLSPQVPLYFFLSPKIFSYIFLCLCLGEAEISLINSPFLSC